MLLFFLIAFFTSFSLLMLIKTYKVLNFELSALKFLNKTFKTIIDHDDTKSLKSLHSDLDIFDKIVQKLSLSLFIITATILINLFAVSFLFLPILHTTSLWGPTVILMSIVNPLMFFISLRVNKWKYTINSICEFYDSIVQSYEFVEEYEKK